MPEFENTVYRDKLVAVMEALECREVDELVEEDTAALVLIAKMIADQAKKGRILGRLHVEKMSKLSG